MRWWWCGVCIIARIPVRAMGSRIKSAEAKAKIPKNPDSHQALLGVASMPENFGDELSMSPQGFSYVLT